LITEEDLYGRLNEINQKLGSMGPVNLAALEEYEEQARRLEFLLTQERDLNDARRQLTETIAEIDETTKVMFQQAFESIRTNFVDMFRRLFGGGRADLVLTEVEGGDPLLDGGVDIIAQPPGKKLQNITLLSGGEKALTAVALLFGIFMHRPSPFCVLDEIDAPLDDNNIERFKQL
jgi:chromosome segregation protein